MFAVVFLIDEFKQQLSCMSCEIGFALKENGVVGWVEVDYEAIPLRCSPSNPIWGCLGSLGCRTSRRCNVYPAFRL